MASFLYSSRPVKSIEASPDLICPAGLPTAPVTPPPGKRRSFMADQFIHHLLLLIHCGTTHVEYFSTLVSSFRWNHSVPKFKLLKWISNIITAKFSLYKLAFICLLTLGLEKAIKQWLFSKIRCIGILFCIFTFFRPNSSLQILF